MPDSTGPIDPDRDPLDLLAEEFADRCRRGETPSVSEYVARFPELAADLKDVLPAVAQMERFKRVRKPVAPAEPPPTRFGDYRIVREVGRGGMGVVYEAVQESLGRRVALKVLPEHSRLDDAKRKRFHREAQAAARLHHTHIVPVFGVGESNGTPYYVMQFIPGCGLNDVLAGWKTDAKPAAGLPRPRQWRRLADIARAAARALHAAHAQGVLHRDVKPANLLLDPRGHLWVTDFGLAKVSGRETLTHTGEVMGTLQYMAPEAFRGAADERTDVYGLGVTLYELAARRPPFDDANPAALIRAIENTDAPPPRNFDPKMPRDLETIILTAVAREPARRYRSAAAFADDLEAFIAGEPIRARRMSATAVGWRWCRRNPAVAGMSAAVALTLGGAAGFGWAMYARADTALAQVSRRLDEEKRLRAEAESTSRKLSESINSSLEALVKVLDAAAKVGPPPGGPGGPGGPKGGPGGPKGGPGGGGPDGGAGGPDKAAQLLEGVLEFYDRFARQNPTDTGLRLNAARASRRVGEIHTHLGHQNPAAAAFARAAALLDGLAVELPMNPDVMKEQMILTFVTVRGADGDASGRIAALRKAAAAGEFVRAAGADPQVNGPLAGIYNLLAKWLGESGDAPGAAAAAKSADAIRPRFGPGERGPPPRRGG